jgi:hypothetical protein
MGRLLVKWALGIRRWRWDDNIKMNYREVYCEGERWME